MKNYIVLLLSLGLMACSSGEDSTPVAEAPTDGDSGPTIPTSCGVDLYLDGDSCVAVSVGEYSTDGDTSKQSCTNTDANVATLTYTSVGGGENNCSFTVDSCDSGHHTEDNLTCVSDTRTQSLDEGEANQSWDGTQWVTDDYNSCNSGYHLDGSNMCVSNTRSCSITNGTGEETWDGSSWGVCTVTSCNEGYTNNTSSCDLEHEFIGSSLSLASLANRRRATLNGDLIFAGDTGTSNGFEILKYDTSLDQVSQIKDIFPGSSSSNPAAFFEFNGEVYFSANDGTNGYEVWKTDGTESGTVMLKDINPGSGSSVGNQTIFYKTSTHLYFKCNDGTNNTYCSTDGTESGTESANLNNGSFHNPLYKEGSFMPSAVHNDEFYFIYGSTSGMPIIFLHKTSGSISDSTQVFWYDTSSLISGVDQVGMHIQSDGDVLTMFYASNEFLGDLFFNDSDLGAIGGSPGLYPYFNIFGDYLIYSYQGDTVAYNGDSSPSTINTDSPTSNKGVVLNDELFFSITAPSYKELFKVTNLSSPTTQALTDIHIGGNDIVSNEGFLKTDSYVYYNCQDNDDNYKICRTDGTMAEVYYDHGLGLTLVAPYISNGYLYSQVSGQNGLFKLKVD